LTRNSANHSLTSVATSLFIQPEHDRNDKKLHRHRGNWSSDSCALV